MKVAIVDWLLALIPVPRVLIACEMPGTCAYVDALKSGRSACVWVVTELFDANLAKTTHVLLLN